MTTLTYTALRNLARAVNFTSFLDAIDISFASADNSINSVTTDLSGLVAGDWVEVLGAGDNDGWHQLDVDSTTTKITINVGTTITDALAGDAISITGYQHASGEIYSLETAAQTLNQSSQATTKVSESLSGVVETLLHREIEFWDIVTGFVTEEDLPLWREFFSSVRAGEAFSFDAYGTIAVPDNVLPCIFVADPSFSRIETTDIYTLSFKVRVQ